MEYLQSTLSKPQSALNSGNIPMLHRSSLINRRKIFLSARVMYSLILGLMFNYFRKRFFCLYRPHWCSSTECVFYISTITCFIPPALSSVGQTPGVGDICSTLQHEYYWSYIANYICKTVKKCHECVQKRPSGKQRQPLRKIPEVAHCNMLRWTYLDHFQSH